MLLNTRDVPGLWAIESRLRGEEARRRIVFALLLLGAMGAAALLALGIFPGRIIEY